MDIHKLYDDGYRNGGIHISRTEYIFLCDDMRDE